MAVVDGSDIVQTQTIDNVLTEVAMLLGENMGETLDIIDREILVAGTTVQYAGSAAARTSVGSGMFMDAAEIREAVRTLKRANAKPHTAGRFIAILHPDTVADMFGDGDILDAFQFAQTRGGGNPVFTGELGKQLLSINPFWISGKAEMPTRSKQAKAVQLQRLSEGKPARG